MISVIPGDMKKIILLFLSSLFILSASGQMQGDGRSPLTAYYGTLNFSANWTFAYNGGTIYVGQGAGTEDLTIGNGGMLTIDPGVKVIFCTQTSDLFITNTGRLIAGGTGSPVTFTRFTPVNNYWGHISFTSTAGSSTLNNCIIEYGDVTRNTAPASYGGGLFVDINNLSLSNCIFRYNKAEWGGGAFINQNKNITINSTYFQNNLSNQGGGGIYFWNNSISTVQNCIFDSNHCNGTTASWYTGGGLATQSFGSTKVLNCTFVNNSSSRPLGQSIMFYSSVNDVALNCIFWGPGTQVYRSGTNTMNYCAVEGAAPAGTGNFLLNASNTAPDGPNFVDPSIANYSITSNSPCRNTGTSTGVPASDILGRTRIVPFDIGAFEYLFNQWKTSASTTDWNNSANWESGVPVLGMDIVIPSGATNYPINTPAPDFTIATGSSLTLGPGAKATLGNLINNGTFTLQSDGTSGDASFIVSSYSGNAANIELFLTGGEAGGTGTKTNRWHFISTPVSSLPVSTFAPIPTKNVAKWWDDRVSGTLASGWVNYAGIVYATLQTDATRTFSTLLPGIGYDYYDKVDDKYTFAGQLNTSDVTMSLSFAVNDGLHGFNLLGNPFSSGLDWNQIIADPSYPLNTSKSLYFTRNNVQCSYVGGIGVPSDVTGIIPPMQGFFVKTYSSGNSIRIPASARVQGTIHPRYKGINTIPLVRLAITENNTSDETVVRFDNLAKSGLDYDFDMLKMFISTANTQIYSSYGGTNYSINGLPFPDSTLSIPIVVNFVTTGTHTITATQLQYLDNYTVTLTDKTTGFVADLKTTPVLTFTAPAGTSSDRFVLKFTNISTGVDNPVITGGKFNIYPSFGYINIQTLADEWDGKQGTVNVLDLSGKIVGSLTDATFSRNSLTSVQANLEKGLYIVELKSGIKRFVGKVVVR